MKVDFRLFIGNESPFEIENYPPIEDYYELKKVVEVKRVPQLGWRIRLPIPEKYIDADDAFGDEPNYLARVVDIITDLENDSNIKVCIVLDEIHELRMDEVSKDLLKNGWKITPES